MSWRLLPTISAPMPLQLALDELLFESQKKESLPPALRFYISSGPWISVGCSFRGSDPFLPEKRGLTPLSSRSALISRNPNVPVTQRMTGGGCVLHGRDLIFSLVARYSKTDTNLEKQKWSQSPLASVRTSYAKIHESVKMGLQLCGLDPKFYDSKEALPKGNDCFDFPVESDLSWKGKKIAGGAQKRSEGVLLHHESISIPQGVEREDLILAIRKGLEQVFGLSIQSADIDPEIFFEAEQLAKDKRLKTRD